MAPLKKHVNPYTLNPDDHKDRLLIEMHDMMGHAFGGPNYRTPDDDTLDMDTWPCIIWEPNSVDADRRKCLHVFLRFPAEYPKVAPMAYLMTSFPEHPHVDEAHRVSSQVLTGPKWNPDMTVEQVLKHVRHVLGHMCPKEGSCPE